MGLMVYLKLLKLFIETITNVGFKGFIRDKVEKILNCRSKPPIVRTTFSNERRITTNILDLKKVNHQGLG